jgi:hypothetical protein
MQKQGIIRVNWIESPVWISSAIFQYIERKLGEIPTGKVEIGHNGQQINDDLQKAELSSNLRSMADGEGFEPSTSGDITPKPFLFCFPAIFMIWLILLCLIF